MSKTDNPAGRLLEILERAKGLEINGQSWLGWSRIFDIPVIGNTLAPLNELELVRRMIQLRILVDETEDSLRNIEGINLDLYLRPFPRIRQAIPLANLYNEFTGQLNSISEGDMTVLAFCSEKLSERHAEKIVDEDQLKELLNQVSSLFDDVTASSLPEELKIFILEQLEIIRRAIYEYRIRGVERLQEALEANIGAFIVNGNLVNQGADYEEVRRLGRIVSGLAAVVTFAADATSLLEAVGKYLPALLPSGH